jgi:hypothetical protein
MFEKKNISCSTLSSHEPDWNVIIRGQIVNVNTSVKLSYNLKALRFQERLKQIPNISEVSIKLCHSVLIIPRLCWWPSLQLYGVNMLDSQVITQNLTSWHSCKKFASYSGSTWFKYLYRMD